MCKTKTKLKKYIVKKLRPGIEPRTGVYVHPAHQASLIEEHWEALYRERALRRRQNVTGQP